MIKKNYKLKKTISMKHLIAEFGENFSEHMKDRLLEIEIRCVLTRKEDPNRFDIKHVEHTKHNCSTEPDKEYVFGQLIVSDGNLYFSEKCREGNDVEENEIVGKIYNSLSEEGQIFYEDEVSAKKIDDRNIDFLIDSLLAACPDVSQEYIAIIKDMLSHTRE